MSAPDSQAEDSQPEGTKSVAFTIGHSTRTLDELIGLLRTHGVTLLVDVRTVPRSRTNPQFNHETLSVSLETADITYIHLPGLGGLRKTRPDSVNTGWRNLSFRGYADYMQTPEFAASLAELMEYIPREQTAIMCAEAVPWRCHRSLVADALLVRGIAVYDILDASHTPQHKLTPWARVEGTRITYPAQES